MDQEREIDAAAPPDPLIEEETTHVFIWTSFIFGLIGPVLFAIPLVVLSLIGHATIASATQGEAVGWTALGIGFIIERLAWIFADVFLACGIISFVFGVKAMGLAKKRKAERREARIAITLGILNMLAAFAIAYFYIAF